MKEIEELVLVDGSGYIFRAYYALPKMSRSDGLPVNAVFGFCNMLLKQLELLQNEKGGNVSVVIIFDAARKTFRNEIFSEYKSNRSEPPDDLIPQFDIIKRIPNVFNLCSIEYPGFEADDLIASYSEKAKKMGIKVTVISSDKDLMQLVSDGVKILDPIKNREIGREEVFNKFGVYPEKVIDVQALAGDSTDNVPGVPGIGIKTAALLINEYGSLEGLLQNFEKIKQQKRREAINDNQEFAVLSKKLVTLKKDVKLPMQIEQLKFKALDVKKLIGFLDEMEFSRIKNLVITKYGTGEYLEKKESFKPKEMNFIIENNIDKKNYKLILNNLELEKIVDQFYIDGVVAIDCETTSLSATESELVGFSMSRKNSIAYYVPLKHSVTEQQIPIKEFIKTLKPLLEDSSILKIGQNIKFDLIVLEQIGIKVENVDDTMLMSYVLSTGKNKHGLDELAKIYLNYDTIKYKELFEKKNAKNFSNIELVEALNYAAEDSDVTLRLWYTLKEKLIKEGLFSFYFYNERPLINVIKQMEINGIKINFKFLEELSRSFEDEIKILEKKIFKVCDTEFNIGSPKQLGEIIFDKLKLPFGKRGKSGNYQTDVKILEKLKFEKFEVAEYLLHWRQLQKLKSTYCEGLISRKNPISKRVHTSFGMASTLTGRLSSNDPNLQNIPIKTKEGRMIRNAFICEKGSKIVSIDYSQIELRILAHVANIQSLKEGFAKGLDIHSLTAQEVFQVDNQNVTDDLRRKAKTINFGIIYGISPYGLASQLDISNSEAKDYIEKYFKKYPGIQNYMTQTIEKCRSKGYVKTLFGRKIYIPFINDKLAMRRNFSERSAINAPIQGGAADMIKRAMNKVSIYLEDNRLKTKMLLQVHDELIFEMPDNELDKIPKKIASIMEESYKPIVDFSVPLLAEVGIGKSWAESH